MKRAEAFALVARQGGKPREGVTRKTDVLVVGELGWPLLDDGRPSNSLAQAKSYGIPVTSERQFLEWVGQGVPDAQAKAYTAAQLAALAKLPPAVVEQLDLFGLIEARGGLYGFRDLAAARQVATLFAAGTALSTITKSLSEIRKWLPDVRLSNLKLFPESSDRLMIEQLQGRTDSRGQYMLDVAAPGDDPEATFAAAQAAEEAGDHETAERLYGRVMKLDPAEPTAAFNLGNVLRARGRNLEAEAAYGAAVKADPSFAAAWYNLADMLEDQRRTAEAIAALRRALDSDPAYLDAMFNLALLLQRLERHAEAAQWWRRYLAVDASSSWAARARRALKFCEIQLLGSA
ncbi:MAG: tetratricopeptide repeat protein [Xanthobacteraceae bacterium]|nr:tetratricopeptide repeat protein [Xanthobacteraceae bacterium]